MAKDPSGFSLTT